MSIRTTTLLFFGALLLCPLPGVAPSLHAQATPTSARTGDLQIGFGATLARPSYSPTVTSSGAIPYFRGGSLYIDFDPSSRWGIELGIHQVYTSNGDQTYERTYEAGGRYLRHYGRLAPYARGMYGRGVYNYYLSLANLAYNLVAGGVGTDYRLTQTLNLRADFEYQKWLNFDPPGGMNPQLVTIGVAYHFPGDLKSRHR